VPVFFGGDQYHGCLEARCRFLGYFIYLNSAGELSLKSLRVCFCDIKGGGGAPPTGWPHTTQPSHPDCRGLEAKPQ
jgi:hypothetical protein